MLKENTNIIFNQHEKEWSDEVMALQYELDKAYETIEDMAEVLLTADLEILSLQQQVKTNESVIDSAYVIIDEMNKDLNILYANEPERTHGNSKLTVTDIKYIDMMLANGLSTKQIGDMFGVTDRTIRYIRQGATHKGVIL